MGFADIVSHLRRGSTAPGGPQTPAQADTAKVAEGLGFPETLTDRFGDVLGTRPRRLSDSIRDGALAAITGDVTAPLKLQTQIARSFAQAVDRKRERALEDIQARRQRNTDVLSAIAQARQFPGNRVGALEALLEGLGHKIHPFFKKHMVDEQLEYEKMQPLLQQAIDDGNFDDQEISDFLSNPNLGIPMLKELQSVLAQEADLNETIARTSGRATARKGERAKQRRDRLSFLTPVQRRRQELASMHMEQALRNREPLDTARLEEINDLIDAQIKREFPQADIHDNRGHPSVEAAFTGQTEDDVRQERFGIDDVFGSPTSSVTQTPSTSQGTSITSTPTFGVGVGTPAIAATPEGPQTAQEQAEALADAVNAKEITEDEAVRILRGR